MLRKYEIIDKIINLGIVAVIRGENIDQVRKNIEACIKGGINIVEVTYTVPEATEIIKKLSKEWKTDLLIGAGTVLDSETARIAILSGAKFIVSPGFDEKTAKLCNKYAIPYMPGCISITEMVKAMELGCDVIKLFPGSYFGADSIKAIKGPLPQINLMPTGGVSLENVDKWFRNGVVAVGVGGKLTVGDEEEIIQTAKSFIEKIKYIRKEINNG